MIVNQDVEVNIIEDDDPDPESPGGKPSVGGKKNTTSMEKNHQTIAQTVVFPFFQQQIHPLSRHFAVPCFGITSTGLVIYFYDSRHDVLLESTPISLLTSVKNEPYIKVNLTAIMASWLAVNYKYLSRGLPESLKSEDSKTDFFSQAVGKIEVYKNSLKSGVVGVAVHPPTDNEVSDESDDLDDIIRSLYEVFVEVESLNENLKEFPNDKYWI
ncbi:uncharacterized protein LOC110463796 [Mizuhopecten yessoensis]|uniref:uncharacterized protein LOC110463796 n=1 Tax=Mizuhopecten yessoensis TaxID=6573 RepID=UPI000B45A1EF|nr:uncharacterized protein LOC110463796 [Mizuhopecten yessoensis]